MTTYLYPRHHATRLDATREIFFERRQGYWTVGVRNSLTREGTEKKIEQEITAWSEYDRLRASYFAPGDNFRDC